MAIQLSGSLAITGSLVATSQIVAQTLNVQQVTSSIVYSSGSNIFGNSVSNTQQFTGSLQVSGSTSYILGNVGIGTTSPATKLDVIGNIRNSNAGQTVYTEIQNDGLYATGTDLYLLAPASKFMSFYTGGGERLRIASTGISCFACQICAPVAIFSGCVGIGTTTPNAQLHVSSVEFDDTYVKIEQRRGGYASSLNLIGATDDGAKYNRIMSQTCGGTNHWQIGGGGVASTMVFLTGNTERVRLDTTGNLMVGSISAGNAGTINVSVGCAGTTAGGIQLWAATNQTHYVQFGDGTAGGAPYAGYVAYAHATDTLSLGTATATRAIISSTGVACFANTVCAPMVLASGCVGIGTTSPNYILDLQTTSTFITNNLKVNASAAANNYAEIAFQLWSGAGSGQNVFGGSETSRPSAVIRALSEDDAARGALLFATFNGGATNATLTEKMRITSCGNVWIGNDSNPMLEIANGGSADVLSGIKWRVGGARDDYGGIYTAAASAYNNYVAFYTRCSATTVGERMRITSGGNVGIGTTSPASFLHIGTYASAGKYIDSSTLPNTPSNYLITLSPPSTTGYYGGGIGWSEGTNTAAGINAYDDGAGGALGLSFATGTNSGLTERMRITSAGAVAIRATCIGLSDIADRTLLLGSRPGNADIVSFGFDPGGTWKAGFDYKGSDGQLEWWTNNGSWCRRIMYGPTGTACFSNTVCAPAAIFTECVGINTTSPGATLHVGGTTGDRSIFICSSCKTSNPAYLRLIGVNSNDATTQFQIVHRGNHSNGGYTDRIDFGVNSGVSWCERVIRLDFNGNVGMCEGSLSVAGGVKFGNGSSTLNYYEQGTWTPRLKNGSFTTNVGGPNTGWYIRVGNIVTVGGTLSWTDGSGAQDGNSLQIACLPFASNNATDFRSVGQFGAPSPSSIGFKNACAQMTLIVDPGASFIYIIENYQSGTYLTYSHSPCANTSGIIYGFQATYITG